MADDPRIFVAPGEFRPDILEMFEYETDGITILLAAPALIPRLGRALDPIARQPWARLSRARSFEHRRVILEHFTGELDRLPQTASWEARLRGWVRRLQNREARVLLYLDEPLFTHMISKPESSLVLSGPLTTRRTQAIGSDELDIVLEGAAHESARQWFVDKAAKAADITDVILDILLASWAGLPLDPEDLYYKVLAEYFGATLEGMDVEADDNPMLDVMTEFQVEAYHHAKGILRRHGGVFLADVVGLGKTFIGLALLRYLQDNHGEHAVVIAPPAVCPAWQELAAEHRVEIQTLSHALLKDIDQYEDREILVIDESHNFRNPGTQRHKLINDWVRPDGEQATRKVILVSATPQNNRPRDVLNQLQLFPDTYTRLPYRGESLEAYFSAVEAGRETASSLLQHVVVRRTRRFIQSAYPQATLRRRVGKHRVEEIPLVFPTRLSGPDQCLRYSIENAYGADLYAAIMKVLGGMRYPLYGLGDYLQPDVATDSRFHGLAVSGRALRGLMKVLFLKRLESSIAAFRLSLIRLRARLQEAYEMLDRGEVRIRVGAHAPSGADDAAEDPPAVVERIEPAASFDVRKLEQDLWHDFEAVNGIIEDVRELDGARDAKLERLQRWFDSRPPARHRTIVFSQFADTIAYLYAQLQQRHGRTAMVSGSTGNALTVARRFAPLGNRAEVPEDQQIDLLLSTDALSEGVNLQDADTLINYDLHWNPVRLIQRAGRIDRIGSPNDEIHVASFLPERALENNLGLEAVLRKRIDDFLQVFGEDSRVLPDLGEGLDEQEMLDAYTGRALDAADEEEDIDALGRHAEAILALRRNDAERYERIMDLRLGRRSLSASSLPGIVASRMGWYWAFFTENTDGNPVGVDDLRGLELFAKHARAGLGRRGDERLNRLLDLGGLVTEARGLFHQQAVRVRGQRAQPRLDATEEWIRSRLEEYRRHCLATRQPLVDRMLAWVMAGQHKVQLRRRARIWKREKLPPDSVFHEMQGVLRKFPQFDDDLGEEEIVGSVLGEQPILRREPSPPEGPAQNAAESEEAIRCPRHPSARVVTSADTHACEVPGCPVVVPTTIHGVRITRHAVRELLVVHKPLRFPGGMMESGRKYEIILFLKYDFRPDFREEIVEG